jgi:formylglycine-generating enzyme required for sulfatase activity
MTFFFKLLRGGSWVVNPWDCRSAYRSLDVPVNTINYVGFRVVCNFSTKM